MPKYMTDIEWLHRQEVQKRKHELQEQAEEGASKIKAKRERESLNEEANVLYNHIAVHEDFSKAAINMKANLKKTLLTEMIYNIYSKSVPAYMVTEMTKAHLPIGNIEKSLVSKFINEQNVPNMLRRMDRGDILLREYAKIVNEAYDSTMTVLRESAKKDKNEVYFPDDAKEQFYSDLAKATPDQVTDSIRSRIIDGINDFLDENRKAQQDVQDICDKANKKIADAGDKPVKESWSLTAKRKIREIETKPTSLFSEMVKATAKNILQNEDTRNIFTSNGKPNFEMIVEAAGLQYALLETVNSLKLINVTPEYIEDQLANMK